MMILGIIQPCAIKGMHSAKRRIINRALTALEKARDGLEIFPRYNLHIVYNNLGICYFLLDKYQDAYQCLLLALRFSQNSMPRIFSTINLACVEAIMDTRNGHLNALTLLSEKSKSTNWTGCVKKYYINYLLVEAIHGNEVVEGQIMEALAYPDRYFPEQTRAAAHFYQELRSPTKEIIRHEWRELYSPCGLAILVYGSLKTAFQRYCLLIHSDIN